MKWVIAGLAVMNAALLASHWSLTRNAQSLVEGRPAAEAQELLRKEAGLLSMERAQLSLKIGVLSDLAVSLKELRLPGGVLPQGHDPQPSPPHEDVRKALELAGIEEKPDVLAIPLMTDEERQEISEASRTLPALSEAPLRSLDLVALLADEAWNPRGRELSPEERGQAMKLMQDYHFFSRISTMERFRSMMGPELPRLREQGAFVEYDPNDGELPFDGFTIDHTEILAKDKFRMYFFPQDQYPDLYHHRQVSREQAQKTFVDLYRLVAKE